MGTPFHRTTLELLRSVREVEIETSRASGTTRHQTTIWVVVDAEDRVLIRTYLGPGSRWYREALSNPECRLRAGDRTLDVRAVPAADEARIDAYNTELLRKYPRSTSTPFMLADQVLPTTMELLPR
ncbi:MAG: nitroreductase/quinone reductase family protein [Chloroflexota bacterium]|nr:nitroreductase/quinone reductase family protein [Chloroflexota bacterium]